MIGVREGWAGSEYSTDDFYQRMLDLGEKATMSFQMNSGTCESGPLHGKRLHHSAAVYRVAVDQHSRKTIPGMVASADPDVRFGRYRWDHGFWVWYE